MKRPRYNPVNWLAVATLAVVGLIGGFMGCLLWRLIQLFFNGLAFILNNSW